MPEGGGRWAGSNKVVELKKKKKKTQIILLICTGLFYFPKF